jgi:aspartate aminotransferase
LTEKLVFGADHPVLAADRVRSVQTPGGGGALRTALDLVQKLAPSTRVWVSGPTWRHHHLVIGAVGLQIREFPYYDTARNELLFDKAIETLAELSARDVILLQGCCHNPTGQDLSPEQWDELADVIRAKGAVPLLDLAYQGFGDGLEEDAYGVRRLAETVPEMFVASTSSKSFGLYRDRAGALSVLMEPNASNADHLINNALRITRGLYFMPPDHGATIVAKILEDPELSGLWRDELESMRQRIVTLRDRLSEALNQQTASRDFDYLTRQKGMFSLLPLTDADAQVLESQWSIYVMPGRRINFAALTADKVSYLAEAVASVYTPQARLTA